MRIRLATPQDFEVYKMLYEDDDISVLYPASLESEVKPQQDSEENDMFDEETMNSILEDSILTREQYEEELADLNNYRIYLVEEKTEIIGFAKLFKIQKNRWKLERLNIIQQYQSQRIVEQVTDWVLMQPQIKTIDVCAFTEAISLMKESGFKERISTSYLRKVRN
ncbi:MAG: GNAT family N-acetyltransferase [Clostridia bacterium]|nr:GNAT family N-acetyltransferase [Clostridia bacterium]